MSRKIMFLLGLPPYEDDPITEPTEQNPEPPKTPTALDKAFGFINKQLNVRQRITTRRRGDGCYKVLIPIRLPSRMVFVARRWSQRGVILPPHLSVDKTGQWDIWMFSPRGIDTEGDGRIDRDWSVGPKGQRWFRRFRLDPKLNEITVKTNTCLHMIGPWSARTFLNTWRDVGEQLLYPPKVDNVEVKIDPKNPSTVPQSTVTEVPDLTQRPRYPWCIAGDNAQEMAYTDYKPTDDEVVKNIETEPKLLWTPNLR